MKRELCYTIPKGAGDMNIIIAKNIRTEKTIRKSRFICSLQRAESEEEAKSFIKDIKKSIGMRRIIAVLTLLMNSSSDPMMTGNRPARPVYLCWKSYVNSR